MNTWFVSGHLDLTQAEFDEHYAPRIREAHGRGDGFVIGDAPGCDLMAQGLLTELGISLDRVTVFHMLEAPRNLAAAFPTRGAYASDELRDAAMTRASNADIAWVRPNKRKNNGTARNLRRREDLNRQLRRELIASWPEYRYVLADDCSGYIVCPPDDPYVQFVTDTVRLPEELVARELAAWREYVKARNEITQLIKEQEED